jgi:hypothetical protein
MGTTLYNPTDFIPEILEWIENGKTLRDYCRQAGKPSYGTVYDWLERDEEFTSRFARARQQGEEVIAQECLAIADDGTNDWMERKTDDDKPLGWILNGEHVQRSRLRVDTRLKLLAKWNPKKWGEKLEHTGDIGIKTVIVPQPAKDAGTRPETSPSFED